MRLTTKGRLAVTALVDLASNGGKVPVTLKSISERRNISVSYLEQLFGKLRTRNIVKSVRGPGGGYYLAVPGLKITIAEIIVAVDDSPDATNYGDKEDDQNGLMCSTDSLWNRLDEVWYSYLSSVSLQQLVDPYQQVRAEATPVTTSKHARKKHPMTLARVSTSSHG